MERNLRAQVWGGSQTCASAR